MKIKNMKNGSLSRYSTELLMAKNILNISTFMHQNVHDLEKYFSPEDMDKQESKLTEEDVVQMQNNVGPRSMYADINDALATAEEEEQASAYMDKLYYYISGKTESKSKDEETGEETVTEQDVRTRIAIFRTPEDARYKRSCQMIVLGGVLSNVVFAPVNNGEYTFYQFGKHDPVSKSMKLKDFDEYSSQSNLNKEAWLFRSMSPKIELVAAYLQKHRCPGIDIDPNDIPMLLERFGLEPASVQDIEELQ